MLFDHTCLWYFVKAAFGNKYTLSGVPHYLVPLISHGNSSPILSPFQYLLLVLVSCKACWKKSHKALSLAFTPIFSYLTQSNKVPTSPNTTPFF